MVSVHGSYKKWTEVAKLKFINMMWWWFENVISFYDQKTMILAIIDVCIFF